MKIEPFLIASTINIAIGQRLVRKICPDCKIKKPVSIDEMKSLSEILPKETLAKYENFYQGAGCNKCDNSGYRGRIGIFEILEINNDIRDAIVRKANANEIKEIAVKNGMTTMIEDGLQKALAGITTIEEILRVINE